MGINYRLEKTTIGKNWDEFVKNSWNGTLFSYSDYLQGICYKEGLYYCYNNQELRAGVVVLETDDGESTVLHGLVPHNGILFGRPTNNQNLAQQTSERFRITEFVAHELPEIYRDIEIRQDPLCRDIRPFLWVNYGMDAPHYEVINLRYTSYLSIQGLSVISDLNTNEIFQNMSTSRKQEVRYARKKGVVTREEFNTEIFRDFYLKTFNRQEVQLEEEVIEESIQLMKKLFSANLGRMFISYSQDNRPGSIAFFGIDHRRGYLLYAANEPVLRNEHTGTAVLWDAFQAINTMGIEEIDMEGINSPERGWFKLSFGGTVSPYYHLAYKGS